MDIPKGWGLTTRGPGRACIQPTTGSPYLPISPSLSNCVLDLMVYPAMDEAHIPHSLPDLASPTGWDDGTDVEMCHAPAQPGPPPPRVEVSADGSWYAPWSGQPLSTGFVDLAERRAATGRWQVTCPIDPAQQFLPRLWWLPASKVAFEELRSGSDIDVTVDAIVTSADLSGYQYR
jgi:hypothetical protein